MHIINILSQLQKAQLCYLACLSDYSFGDTVLNKPVTYSTLLMTLGGVVALKTFKKLKHKKGL